MQELSRQDLGQKLTNSSSSFALFLYTPICGTCSVTKKMLSIVEVMEPDLPLFQSDLNYMLELSIEWQIQSVPCIAIIEQGQVKERIYRMESVENLLNKLRPLNKRTELQ
ncbi:thioredoxin [Paenibacillus albiflavus]|uniref:Thioredoxin n=1 Tax=Paenibacillus albiflavus TaxID=2545760 RepID=A0A4R4EMF3_9BACL|nr:thioredoxin family protein [Paenibacillus albiflavus]TCZ81007.1 thioredoxin [Paenibacillus albiflavus]